MGSALSHAIDIAKLHGGEKLVVENVAASRSAKKLPKIDEIISQLPKLRSISIKNCGLTRLPKDVYLLTNLMHLELEGNLLPDLPLKMKDLTNLKTLDLSRNQLETFPVVILEFLQLHSLDLSFNSVTKINFKLARSLPSLQTLNLQGNGIKNFMEPIAELYSLTSLDLSMNQLKELPQNFTNLTLLKILNLQRNYFEDLPIVLTRLYSLEHLNLSMNFISKSGAVLSKLTTLRVLELQHNSFAEASQITNLLQLEVLKLQCNKITSLPDDFGVLTKLEELYIHENKLSALPTSFSELKSLKKLFLEFNELETLPDGFDQLEKLHWLFLHHNRMTTIPKPLMNYRFLQNLIALSLSSNKFEPLLQNNLSQGALNHLQKLASNSKSEQTKLPIDSKKNLFTRVASAGRLPRFTTSPSMQLAAPIDEEAFRNSFNGLLKRHDFTEKTIQYLNDLEFKKKWEFLNQYAGSSLNLMRNDPPNPQSPGKLKNAKSNRTLVTLKEEKKDDDKDKDNNDNSKDKSPTKTIKAPKSPKRGKSPPKILQRVSSMKQIADRSSRKSPTKQVTVLQHKQDSSSDGSTPTDSPIDSRSSSSERRISPMNSTSSERSISAGKSAANSRDRISAPRQRARTTDQTVNKRKSMNPDDAVQFWIDKLSESPSQKDLFSLRIKILSLASAEWLHEFVTEGGVGVLFKVLSRPLENDTAEEEGSRIEALRIFNVLLKSDLQSMLLLSDSLKAIVENLMSRNELVRKGCLYALLKISAVGGIYQKIVVEAIMHIVNSYGSPIVLALLYREIAGDNPDEQANIKGSLILLNILLEKCETLQSRFEMETHLIGMGILRTTKKLRKRAEKNRSSEIGQHVLEEIDIFERQLRLDFENACQSQGSERIVDKIRNAVAIYREATKSTRDYDPVDEPLLKQILHSPRSPSGQWTIRVYIPKRNKEVTVVLDPVSSSRSDSSRSRSGSSPRSPNDTDSNEENKKASRRHSGSRFMITNKSGENISSEENSNSNTGTNNTNHSPSTSSPLERSRSSSLQKKLNEGALTVNDLLKAVLNKLAMMDEQHISTYNESDYALYCIVKKDYSKKREKARKSMERITSSVTSLSLSASYGSDDEEIVRVKPVAEFWLDTARLLTDYHLDKRDFIIELRQKPIQLKVKSFIDTYEMMTIDVETTVVKIKEQIAQKILNEDQLQIWHNEDYGLILETAGGSDGFFLKDSVKIGIYFTDPSSALKKLLRLTIRPRRTKIKLPSGLTRYMDIYFTHPLRAVIYQICTQASLRYDPEDTGINGDNDQWVLLYYEKDSVAKGKILNISSTLRGQGIIYSDTGYFELVENSQKEFLESRARGMSQSMIDISSGTLEAASLDYLVEILTSEKDYNKTDCDTFLLTYRSFATPDQLLNKLIERWHIPKSLADEHVIASIKLRVLVFINYWVMRNFDHLDNPRFLERLKRFIIDAQQTDTKYKDTVDILLKAILQREKEMEYGESSRSESLAARIPFSPRSELDSQSSTVNILLSWDELALAQQLTLMISKHFLRIKSHELLGQVWNNPLQHLLAPNIVATVKHFNTVSSVIASALVLEVKLKTRRKLYKKFVKLAKHLKDLKNYHTLMAVLSGLNNSAVARMTHTKKMTKSYREVQKDLESTMSMEGGFRNYQQCIVQIVPPCIPYMGAHLMELTFIEEGNLDFTEGLINWRKCRMLYQVISKIEYFQKVSYEVESNDMMQEQFLSLPQLNEVELFEVSQLREPQDCNRTDLQ